MPASVQCELTQRALKRGPGSVDHPRLWEAAQGGLMHNDDTPMNVLELTGLLKQGLPLREDAPELDRTDDAARRFQLSDEQRMRLHQRRSQPVMNTLHGWLIEQLEQRHVEQVKAAPGRWLPWTYQEQLAESFLQPGSALA